MPFTKPLVLPEWATDDIGNGPLGALNVQTPPSSYFTDGWDYGETPPREFFNWLGRYTYLNIGWLVQETDALLISKSNKDADNYFRSQW